MIKSLVKKLLKKLDLTRDNSGTIESLAKNWQRTAQFIEILTKKSIKVITKVYKNDK